MSCKEAPTATFGAFGDMEIELRVASLTVNDVVPTIPAKTAVMVELPGDTPLATPLLAVESLIVTTDDGEEVQVAEAVRFCVLPSANVAIAV